MLAAASRRGRSHAHVGGCRDDDFSLISSRASGWHVLAVSDGAGSAKYSRGGSRIAVQWASEVLADKLGELDAKLEKAILAWQQGRVDEENEHEKTLKDCLYNVFRAAVYEPVKKIHELAKKEELQYRDFYATLLLCAHKTIGDEQFVAGYWIGDGAMAVYAEDEYTKLFGEPDGGEYAGQTRFLDADAVSSREKIEQRIHFDSQVNLSAVFLMTDGVSDPKFETDANLQKQKVWDDFWNEEIQPRLDTDPGQASRNLLAWLGFWSPGNHDDRTLALLYPASVVTKTANADTAEDTPKEEIPDTEGTGDE
uniref:Protein phosphatase 2C n=1 Tax=Candidatus Kentrum sp. UNK TaxID=2126344 RepID=A0A451AZN3_9GAMM|nr:MAG: Protein phosphatase 2C [Candidatus Kentron sp. UNK]VFK71518.1 MAG: Protein phosphatase 2C [Candidatus Kentron sp. UNK]